MEVDNDTSTPVNYEQSGGGDDEEVAGPAPPQGNLPGNGGKANFAPAGPPPWTVRFWDNQNQASSQPFSNASATVTLNANWTVTVS